MRVLMLLLLAAAVLFLAETVTGIRSIHSSSGADTVVTYARWYERLLALLLSALHAIAFYGVYRRYVVAWRFGFVAWYLAGALFVFQVWWLLWREPYGWVGAAVATAFAPLVVLYWASWWRRQRPYFSADRDQKT
jgi:hypothetical protein